MLDPSFIMPVLTHGCVDALQPAYSLCSVWLRLDLFGGSWKAADFLESLFACRCLMFWYSFCSVLIGSAWFRSCWQENPHLDCCKLEFCIVSRQTCVLTVATPTLVIRYLIQFDFQENQKKERG